MNKIRVSINDKNETIWKIVKTHEFRYQQIWTE